MGVAISLLIRRQIVSQRQSGKSFASISRELGVSYSGVRKIWARFEAYGLEGLGPSYENCGPPPLKLPDLLYRAACYLRRLHPSWGSPLIHQILTDRYKSKHEVPSARTVHRWLKKAGLIQKRQRPVSSPRRWADKPHEVWQIDAKEKVKLETGKRVCWLSVGDEKSRAILGLKAFPPQDDHQGRAKPDSAVARSTLSTMDDAQAN